jgi:hypothetical protein
MARTHLATYLNDHLAGSVIALEMLEHLEKAHAETPVAAFAIWLRAEIAEDRQELEALMGRLEISQSPVRKAAAWISEKLTQAKLKMDDSQEGSLRLLEIFEALSLGIEGKRLLWISLSTASETTPDLAGTDYGRLEQRAEEQRKAVEAHRRDAARSAFGASASD